MSPSMSGSYSLAYLERVPRRRAAGFVPVAPVDIDTFEPARRTPRPSRPLSIWGSEDPSYTPERAEHLLDQLQRRPRVATTEIIEDAGARLLRRPPGGVHGAPPRLPPRPRVLMRRRAA